MCDCLLDSSKEENKPKPSAAVKRRDPIPLHLRSKLRACGKKSALYSPRTAFYRSSANHLPSKTEKKPIPQSLQPSDLSVLTKLGFTDDDLKLLQMESLIHQAKFQSLLHRLRKEHEKNENDIKNRAAKIALMKAIRHRINRVNDRKTQNKCYKSAKLTFENILKDRKRDEAISRREIDESVIRNPADTSNVFQRFVNADREAEKFFGQFLRRQTREEINAADSVENCERDKIKQMFE